MDSNAGEPQRMSENGQNDPGLVDELFAQELSENYYNFRNRSAASYSKKYETWKRTRNIIRAVSRELRRKQQATVADIGCNSGRNIFLLNFLSSASQRAVSFRGIDNNTGAIAVARRINAILGAATISFDCADALASGLPAASCDIVLCTEVIEHLPDPALFLAEMKRILVPGGMMLITTPNATNGGLVFKPLKGKKDTRTGCYGDESTPHVSVKGLREWITIFKGNGFTIEQIKRGSLFCGGGTFDVHPVLFGAYIVLDAVLDYLPFMLNATENLTFTLRKE
jgi:2-polyprenyl-3-methyl-5-hydroxy-6-metoxy-1,4-benzoquinol methylase